MFLWIAIMVLAVFLDQLTKYLTILFLKPIDTFPIIEDVLHLTYVENPGAAFGIMKDKRWLFMIVSTVAIVALLIYLFKKKTQPKLENLAIAFIVGGGIGNMIDRVVLGYVVDMIDFRLIDFAVFNVADSFVCVGAGLLMLHIILSGVKEYKEEKEKKLAPAEGEDAPEAKDAESIEVPSEDEATDDQAIEDETLDSQAIDDQAMEDEAVDEASVAMTEEMIEMPETVTEDENHE